jgi:hypothetical protein
VDAISTTAWMLSTRVRQFRARCGMMMRRLVLDDQVYLERGIAEQPQSSNQKSRTRAIANNPTANDNLGCDIELLSDLSLHRGNYHA